MVNPTLRNWIFPKRGKKPYRVQPRSVHNGEGAVAYHGLRSWHHVHHDCSDVRIINCQDNLLLSASSSPVSIVIIIVMITLHRWPIDGLWKSMARLREALFLYPVFFFTIFLNQNCFASKLSLRSMQLQRSSLSNGVCFATVLKIAGCSQSTQMIVTIKIHREVDTECRLSPSKYTQRS